MLLTLLLDALSAAGEGKALVLFAKLLFFGLLPLVLLIYLLVQLANQRLNERLDREWTEQKAQAAAAKRYQTLLLLVLCCVFIGVTWGWSTSD
jgi:ABC-type sulfate transport system permease component